jgi:2-(1,2-epoxy-1,2-dihydrophenyl)acetyl-CoA isomerase
MEVSSGVATITLNRPERRNAINAQMARDLISAVEMFHADPAARCAVVTGAGPSFCSGGDVKDMGEMILGTKKIEGSAVRLFSEPILKFWETPKPIVASINGDAVGGGLSLALACDLRIAARRARFGMAFVRLGLMPDLGGSYLLPRIVGPAKAYELMVTGELFSADEARGLGVVNRVVEDGALVPETRALAERLARGPTRALGKMKMAILSAHKPLLEAHLQGEFQGQEELSRSQDFKEGVAAFLQKREPKFRGA